jgi:hypothetical protein
MFAGVVKGTGEMFCQCPTAPAEDEHGNTTLTSAVSLLKDSAALVATT